MQRAMALGLKPCSYTIMNSVECYIFQSLCFRKQPRKMLNYLLFEGLKALISLNLRSLWNFISSITFTESSKKSFLTVACRNMIITIVFIGLWTEATSSLPIVCRCLNFLNNCQASARYYFCRKVLSIEQTSGISSSKIVRLLNYSSGFFFKLNLLRELLAPFMLHNSIPDLFLVVSKTSFLG